MREWKRLRRIQLIDRTFLMRHHIDIALPQPNVAEMRGRTSRMPTHTTILRNSRIILRLQQRLHLRQPRLQSLHIPPLGSRLPPNLIVITVMLQPRACPARRLIAIALQFPFPAQHARYPLRLRHLSVRGILLLGSTTLLLGSLLTVLRRLLVEIVEVVFARRAFLRGHGQTLIARRM